MKYISISLLLLLLNCQKKMSADTKSENYTTDSPSGTRKDTVQSAEVIQAAESEQTDTVIQNQLEQTKEGFVEADADFQWEANNKLTKLLNYYGKNLPDYFGGGAIDDKGNLVINIKGNLKNGRMNVTKIIGSKGIIFKSSKFSNKELNDIMEYLNAFAQKDENKKFTSNLSAWSLMEDHVEVCFKVMHENSEVDFRKYILDSEALRFKECGEFKFN